MPNDRSVLSMDEAPAVTGLMGLGTPMFQRARKNADQMDAQSGLPAGDLTYTTAEIRDLRAEVERLRSERDRLQEMQARILELLGTDRADRLVHDLRNVLNERALFRALAETVM